MFYRKRSEWGERRNGENAGKEKRQKYRERKKKEKKFIYIAEIETNTSRAELYEQMQDGGSEWNSIFDR
jgi:hypothetical protein